MKNYFNPQTLLPYQKIPKIRIRNVEYLYVLLNNTILNVNIVVMVII